MDKVAIRTKFSTKFLNNIQNKPAQIITFSFFFIICVGTFLLSLPVSTKTGEAAGLIAALFTSTSAVCVTGLVVVDTSTYWSIFGQTVIIALIQIGGLSVVTLTTFFFTVLKRRMGIRTMVLAQDSTASFTLQDVRKMLGNIIAVTFSFELIGAILLSTRLIPRFGMIKGMYISVFHAVSAFCNAGFDLYGQFYGKYVSLMEFNDDPVIILTTAVLIIAGGLGFIVWADLFNLDDVKGLNFYTKLILKMTSILLIVGTVFFLIVEFGNLSPGGMGRMPFMQKLQAAFFQAVTCRTAGFNSIDQASLTDSSKIFSSFLMFIGAASGSTGGGIKVSTASVIFFFMISEIKGASDTLMFGRKINSKIVSKSLVIASMVIVLLAVDTTVISVIESRLLSTTRVDALDILFEATSAFGTVGLSSVGTPRLHDPSKIILILTMFIGRVGPVAFAMAITGSAFKNKEKVYPEARIHVG